MELPRLQPIQYTIDTAHAFTVTVRFLVDDPDPKGNQENAHHPKHEAKIHLEPDLQEMLDCLRSEGFNPTAELTAIPEEKLQKVSAWIYPKLHQEINGRPTELLGGCGSRLEECSRRKPVIVWMCQKEKDHHQHHNEPHDWRPSEWLVSGRICKDAPVYDHSERGRIVHQKGMTYPEIVFPHNKHPEPINIEGHLVQNSPFLLHQTIVHLHKPDDAVQGSGHRVRLFVPLE